MHRKNHCLGLFLLLCILTTSSLFAQKKQFEAAHFYLGGALGNSIVAPEFAYGANSSDLEPFREGQYMLRLFGGYTWQGQHSLELSLEGIPNHSGAQMTLQDDLIGRVIERSNSISLNAGYLWQAFQWGALAFRLGPQLGLAATLEDRGPVSIYRIAYPNLGPELPYIELSAEMQRRVFLHFGGQAELEWGLGPKKVNVLFLTGGLHYSPSTLQRYSIRYRPVEGPEQQSSVETNLRTWFLGVGIKHRPSRLK